MRRLCVVGVLLALLASAACGTQASPTPTVGPATATPVPAATRVPATATPTVRPATATPTPTATRAPATATPTVRPATATPVPPATRVPATPTPTIPPATATPTPMATSAFDFRVESVTRIPNCERTQITGYVWDASGKALPGQRVKVGIVVIGEGWSATSNPTTSDGYYDVTISNDMKPGRWYVYMVDGNGAQISDRVEVVTDDDVSRCHPEGTGNQTPRVDFRRRS